MVLSQESPLKLKEGEMPEQKQSDIPSPEQIRADDAFAKRVVITTVVVALFGALGYGLSCWICWETSGSISMESPDHRAILQLGTLGFLMLGIYPGWSLTRPNK